ncbi:flagellar basal body rod protein FlgB [Gracilibacillus salitolerans]|uniref:Flagellar basal body rod protein FlgB n=1 Tax=Gracilibacillus salitolerans TaxID=2663022 RepID=A0A5Q2TKW4_9BACI|nr:flagellar basal body rod protein FlgB [Gracilibacillus salitolerans]QGH34530.1 flagellar basal body rod protein FlgB [Gracilibacillus salitolerans]
MSLFGGTIQTLENSLQYASVKNKTIAHNISNADTSNYKAKKVQFNDVLKNELSNQFQATRTNERHIPFSSDGSNINITTDRSTMYNHNGNNVDIDKEMTELAKNQIYYQGLVDRMNGKFNSLQSVIRGGS